MSADPHVLLGRIVDAATDLAHHSTRFQAVGYVDRDGNVRWEKGRQPEGECLIYVVRRNDTTSGTPNG